MPANLAGERVAASVAQVWNGAAHTLAVGAILLACSAYWSRLGRVTLGLLAKGSPGGHGRGGSPASEALAGEQPPLGAAAQPAALAAALPVVRHLGFSVTVSGSEVDGLCG